MPAPNKITDKQLEALKKDYEKGCQSIRGLSKSWKISSGTLQAYIKKGGWIKEIVNQRISAIAKAKLTKEDYYLSQENHKKLIEAGGNELYNSTVEYFKNANYVQAATQDNLVEHKKLFNEAIEGPDLSKCDGSTKAILDVMLTFYSVQQKQMDWLLTSQRFVQSAAKSATEMIMGVRGSLGLNNQSKDDKAGDIYNIQIIADGLREGMERLDKAKTVTDRPVIVAEAELIE